MNNKIKWTGALFLLVNGSWVWAASLPADLTWGDQTTPTPCSPLPRQLPGSNLNLFVDSFPLTFRTVGPDSTARFRSFILDKPDEAHQLPSQHGQPHSGPGECLGHRSDSQTVWLKLDPRAKWSDGKAGHRR